MNLVVDANVIFAALIRNSFSYNLLFTDKFNLFTSEYIFTEFEDHKEEILEKTERTTEEFFNILNILKRRITLIPLEELTQYIKEAQELTPDPDDMVYFALALKLNCPIWSNDKKLKQQNKIIIYHTHELARL
ncbi:PIN domain-containing protein [Candidatus Woesearchaeota archaeon]|nr:PIN domain-containing protein [Candidatus Woesearchaeota archaeon]